MDLGKKISDLTLKEFMFLQLMLAAPPVPNNFVPNVLWATEGEKYEIKKKTQWAFHYAKLFIDNFPNENGNEEKKGSTIAPDYCEHCGTYTGCYWFQYENFGKKVPENAAYMSGQESLCKKCYDKKIGRE